jgi:hypothetical protein
VFTGCDKDEDEGKIDAARLSGVWEVTHTALAERDGFPSFEEAKKWLNAFDWEKANKVPYVPNTGGNNNSHYGGGPFFDFRTDGKVDAYYPDNRGYSYAKINIPYTLDGQNIIIDPDYPKPEKYRIVTLSRDNLVLEEIYDYMITESQMVDNEWDVSVTRVFLTKRTAVPDIEDYTIYDFESTY